MTDPTKVSIAGIAPVTIVADTRPETRFEYQVVGFPPGATTNVKDYTRRGAERLEEAIDTYAVDGWEFFRSETVWMVLNPGCMGAILGAKKTSVPTQQLVFRRRLK